EPGAARGRAESARLGPVDRPSDPAVAVLDEDLDHPAADLDTALDGAGSSSGDRLMGAQGQIESGRGHAGILAIRRESEVSYDGFPSSRCSRSSCPILRVTKICLT